MFVLFWFAEIEQCAKCQLFGVQLVLSAKCIVQQEIITAAAVINESAEKCGR